MTKKTRVQGFLKPLELNYNLMQDDKRNYFSTFYFSTALAADDDQTFDILTAAPSNGFVMKAFELSFLDIYSNTGTYKACNMAKLILASLSGYLSIAYPGNMAVGPAANPTVSGDMSQRKLRFEMPGGLVFNGNDQFRFQLQIRNSTAYLITDTLICGLVIEWELR